MPCPANAIATNEICFSLEPSRHVTRVHLHAQVYVAAVIALFCEGGMGALEEVRCGALLAQLMETRHCQRTAGLSLRPPKFSYSAQPLRAAPKDRQPPTVTRQPPTANRHQPLTANRHPQPTATNREPTNRQPPPTTNRKLPPTTNRQPPPTASHRSILFLWFCVLTMKQRASL